MRSRIVRGEHGVKEMNRKCMHSSFTDLRRDSLRVLAELQYT